MCSVILPPASGVAWYVTLASIEQQRCTRDVLVSLPTILQGGAGRFFRSLCCGVSISLDYKVSLWGLESDSELYSETEKQIHSRSANKILDACLKNAGLYIKFGQGMVTSP